MLARIHFLPIPLAKEKNPYRENIQQRFNEAYATHDVEGIIKRLKLKHFLKQDIRKELEFIDKAVEAIDSPMVFCHNDFRGANILVIKPDNDVLICDFEYSRYGPRGIDIASIMSCHGRKPLNFQECKLPPNDVLENFVLSYIEEMNKLDPDFANKDYNSLERIKSEIKVYLLYHRLCALTFIMSQTNSLVKSMQYSKDNDMVNIVYF